MGGRNKEVKKDVRKRRREVMVKCRERGHEEQNEIRKRVEDKCS